MSALIIFVVLGCLNGLQASEEISLNRPFKSPWNTEQLSTGKFVCLLKKKQLFDFYEWWNYLNFEGSYQQIIEIQDNADKSVYNFCDK